MPKERPPVRPTTPPQLRLIELGSKRERELFAAEVLKSVMKSEGYHAVNGFGSAVVEYEDKQGAINDELATEREEVRWKTAEHTTLMLRLDKNRSETSRSEPQSRAQSPYTYTPAIQRHHSARANPSRGWFTAHSNAVHIGKGLPGQPESRSAHFFGDSVKTAEADEDDHTFLTATKVEEPRLAKPSRERTHTHRKQEQAVSHVQHTMLESLDRWQARPQIRGKTNAKPIGNYVGMDSATETRVRAEASRTQQLADVVAYYSQPGLPFEARNGNDMMRDKLQVCNENLNVRKSRLGACVRKEQEENTPEVVALRASVTAAIHEDNKLVRKDDPVSGRTFFLPPAAAASVVSEPGPNPWDKTAPWTMDKEAGEWVRLDKSPERDPPWVVRQPKKTPQVSVYDVNQRRTLVNRVDLPSHPPPVSSAPAQYAVPRASINMGGGFVFRSDIDVDPQRPTPSRPAYSRGLFLFPFSNEHATRLVGSQKHASLTLGGYESGPAPAGADGEGHDCTVRPATSPS